MDKKFDTDFLNFDNSEFLAMDDDMFSTENNNDKKEITADDFLFDSPTVSDTEDDSIDEDNAKEEVMDTYKKQSSILDDLEMIDTNKGIISEDKKVGTPKSFSFLNSDVVNDIKKDMEEAENDDEEYDDAAPKVKKSNNKKSNKSDDIFDVSSFDLDKFNVEVDPVEPEKIKSLDDALGFGSDFAIESELSKIENIEPISIDINPYINIKPPHIKNVNKNNKAPINKFKPQNNVVSTGVHKNLKSLDAIQPYRPHNFSEFESTQHISPHRDHKKPNAPKSVTQLVDALGEYVNVETMEVIDINGLHDLLFFADYEHDIVSNLIHKGFLDEEEYDNNDRMIITNEALYEICLKLNYNLIQRMIENKIYPVKLITDEIAWAENEFLSFTTLIVKSLIREKSIDKIGYFLNMMDDRDLARTLIVVNENLDAFRELLKYDPKAELGEMKTISLGSIYSRLIFKLTDSTAIIDIGKATRPATKKKKKKSR